MACLDPEGMKEIEGLISYYLENAKILKKCAEVIETDLLLNWYLLWYLVCHTLTFCLCSSASLMCNLFWIVL